MLATKAPPCSSSADDRLVLPTSATTVNLHLNLNTTSTSTHQPPSAPPSTHAASNVKLHQSLSVTVGLSTASRHRASARRRQRRTHAAIGMHTHHTASAAAAGCCQGCLGRRQQTSISRLHLPIVAGSTGNRPLNRDRVTLSTECVLLTCVWEGGGGDPLPCHTDSTPAPPSHTMNYAVVSAVIMDHHSTNPALLLLGLR